PSWEGAWKDDRHLVQVLRNMFRPGPNDPEWFHLVDLLVTQADQLVIWVKINDDGIEEWFDDGASSRVRKRAIDRTEVSDMLTVVGVVKMKSPYDRALLAKKLKLDKPKKVDGQDYHELIRGGLGKTDMTPILAMPDDQTLPFYLGNTKQLGPVLNGTAKGSLDANAKDLMRAGRDAASILAVGFPEALRKQMKKLPDPKLPFELQDLKPVVDAFKRSRGAGLWATIDGSTHKVTLAMNCDNSDDAGKTIDALQKVWNKYKGMMQDQLEKAARQG